MKKTYANLFTGGEAPAAPEPPAAERYRILLVDDEPNILRALRRVFRQENYEVVTAASGPEALGLLREEPFHVVIADFMMPVMNGGELLRQVRQLRPETIRIMLTGHADVNAVMGAMKAGAVYKFILKPWNDDDLRVTMALALEQHELLERNRRLRQENATQSKELVELAKYSVSNRSQIAIMLNKKNLLNLAQVQELFRLQQSRREPALRMILERGWVEEKAIHDILRRELLLDEVALDEVSVDPAVASLVPHTICQRQWVVPLKLEGRRLLLAVADPLDAGLLDDLRFITGLELTPVLASSQAILAKITEVYGSADGAGFNDLETIVNMTDPYEGIEIVIDDGEDNLSLEDLLHGTEEPPAIRLVNSVILEAIRQGASDIHIQPRTKNVMVRYRIDGILMDKIQIPHALHQSFVSRLKVMSELDISERRRPQDGRITVKTPLRVVDLRISTLPTINGEKVVMRILDRNAAVLSLEGLGFQPGVLARLRNVVDKPQGIILATGPTGSGKTTTLYSMLHHNATPSKNYVTIEDPVEYYLDAAGQVLIREKIGLTFPVVLRSILRQDPDVILLGEIRDFETAEVAFHAALTGHQVFSTLHTNSAVATISRLLDLGLKPYVAATALEAIIAQRLVRRICPHCREAAPVPADLLERLGDAFRPGSIATFRGRGCRECHSTGYKGRLGLYEVLVPDDRLRHLIATSASMQDISQAARQAGSSSLIEDAAIKVSEGLTTAEEVLRVLGPQ
ncbi:MAG: Flp pilus assembly complex ATPase component TadA [Betaproteobacteria bacterium]|jgi:type II secretory ATPase GspE/PulE/Tfp pilus assembly ATPase PilB-like protein/CheY-like chemotaxis protein|nr:Flp pilus assembly complex ATPase component TadA [Betaproteobacteria bacterium]